MINYELFSFKWQMWFPRIFLTCFLCLLFRATLCLRFGSACLITALTTVTSTKLWKVFFHMLIRNNIFYILIFLSLNWWNMRQYTKVRIQLTDIILLVLSPVCAASGLPKTPGFIEFTNEWLCLGFGGPVCKWSLCFLMNFLSCHISQRIYWRNCVHCWCKYRFSRGAFCSTIWN